MITRCALRDNTCPRSAFARCRIVRRITIETLRATLVILIDARRIRQTAVGTRRFDTRTATAILIIAAFKAATSAVKRIRGKIRVLDTVRKRTRTAVCKVIITHELTMTVATHARMGIQSLLFLTFVITGAAMVRIIRVQHKTLVLSTNDA